MEEIKTTEKGENMKQNFEKIAEENLENWFQSLHTGNLEKMREKYLANCTFFPTLDPNLRIGTDAAVDYFSTHFMPKKPIGKVISAKTTKLTENQLLHIGHYDFEIGEKDNRSTISARFVFIWEKTTDGKWGIRHHSSDKLPEKH